MNRKDKLKVPKNGASGQQGARNSASPSPAASARAVQRAIDAFAESPNTADVLRRSSTAGKSLLRKTSSCADRQHSHLGRARERAPSGPEVSHEGTG